MRNTSVLFRTHYIALLITAPLLLVSAVLILINALPQLRLLALQWLAQPDAVCGCEVLFTFSNHPWLYTGLIVAALFAIYILVAFTIHIVRGVMRTARYIHSLSVAADAPYLFTHNGVLVRMIQHSEPLLFTVGLLRPWIIASQRARDTLTAMEWEAVMAHEAAHAQRFDPLKRLVVFSLIDTFWFIPGMRELKESVELTQELAADYHALHHVKRDSLLSALTRCIEQQAVVGVPAVVPRFALMTSRLNTLLYRTVEFPHQRRLFIAFASLIILTLIAMFSSQGLFLSAAAQTVEGQTVTAACIQEYEAVLQSVDTTLLGHQYCELVIDTPLPHSSSVQRTYLTPMTISTILNSR